MSSENVLANWPAKMSPLIVHGKCPTVGGERGEPFWYELDVV